MIQGIFKSELYGSIGAKLNTSGEYSRSGPGRGLPTAVIDMPDKSRVNDICAGHT